MSTFLLQSALHFFVPKDTLRREITVKIIKISTVYYVFRGPEFLYRSAPSNTEFNQAEFHLLLKIILSIF